MLSSFRQSTLRLVQRQTALAKIPQVVESPLGVGGGNCSYWEQHQVRWRSNRSRRGLYNGKDIRTGNNVSFSMRATKRTFKPNVFIKRVYSDILGDMVRFHLTASTLRSIDKAGGLDNYLLNSKWEFTEGEGYKVKRAILKKLKNQERYERKQAEREGAESNSAAMLTE
mmetsp:Transcript_9088/g.17335  ORF Transcript_9088/g.17335 Transcript_9088/m.17335 type:complete len:169 (+) Transcript_9088:50-556(+)